MSSHTSLRGFHAITPDSQLHSIFRPEEAQMIIGAICCVEIDLQVMPNLAFYKPCTEKPSLIFFPLGFMLQVPEFFGSDTSSLCDITDPAVRKNIWPELTAEQFMLMIDAAVRHLVKDDKLPKWYTLENALAEYTAARQIAA